MAVLHHNAIGQCGQAAELTVAEAYKLSAQFISDV